MLKIYSSASRHLPVGSMISRRSTKSDVIKYTNNKDNATFEKKTVAAAGTFRKQTVIIISALQAVPI
jgi:hypothetical protein